MVYLLHTCIALFVLCSISCGLNELIIMSVDHRWRRHVLLCANYLTVSVYIGAEVFDVETVGFIIHRQHPDEQRE